MKHTFDLNRFLMLAALNLFFGVSTAVAADAGSSDAADYASTLFNRLDANADGYITPEEAAGTISSETFNKADANHDGKLSLAEFLAAKLAKAE
jgi:Ca2+-binding EF-hand superfamily protein